MVIYCFLIVVVNLITDLTYGADRSASEARVSGDPVALADTVALPATSMRRAASCCA